VDLPVEFYVDPEIFTDPTTKEVRAITLSYTFYRSEKDTDDDSDKTAQQNVTKLNKIEG
jgi:cytochrome c oxidase assembly protein subunit 11